MNYSHYFTGLLNYEQHANSIIIDRLTSLSQELKPAVRLMSHILNAQEIWADRMESLEAPPSSWQDRKLEELSEGLDHTIRRLKKIINSKVLDNWGAYYGYTTSEGKYYRNTYGETYTHLMIHSSQHRGQIAWLLKPHIDQSLDLDYIFYKRE